MTMHLTRLLGFAPLDALDDLAASLAAVPGPGLRTQRIPHTAAGLAGCAALLQDEPELPLMQRSRETLAAGLQTVQRRLEIACAAGRFLPMDPSAACCPASLVGRLLQTQAAALAAALAAHGARHQWDIVLRWKPEDVLARCRGKLAEAARQGAQVLAEAVAAALAAERDRCETALLAALRPAVLGFAEAGAARAEAEIAVTVLVRSDAEAAVEAALDGLGPEFEPIGIDMRGPLPPLSFAAVRLAMVRQQEVTAAWQRLGLPERTDAQALHRQWRLRAAAVHPDRGLSPSALAATASVAELTDAYRLLRGLLSPAMPEATTLTGLLDRAGPRLIIPADASDGLSEDVAADALQPELEPVS